MARQKYNRGDLVMLKASKDFPEGMSHFDGGVKGIVQYSYGDRYDRPGSGGGYSIILRYGKNDWSPVAWYQDACIEKLISHETAFTRKMLLKHYR